MLNQVIFWTSSIGIGTVISLLQLPVTANTANAISTASASIKTISTSHHLTSMPASERLTPADRERRKLEAAERIVKANELFSLAVQKANKGDRQGAIAEYSKAYIQQVRFKIKYFY